MSSTPDHYEVLGVPRDASIADIERARKRLALVWHPDRNQHPDAAGRFDEVQKAAEVLRDPATRAAYDRDFALRVAMSLPLDLRDRRPPAPAPSHPAPARTAPAHAAPAHTAPEHAGRGHARPRWRRIRPRAASRKARLWAGLAALAAVTAGGIAVAFSAGQGQPAPAPSPSPSASRPAKAAATGGTGGGPGMFPLPQYTPGQAVLPVTGGRVLSIGPGIALLTAGGHVAWHDTAQVHPLNINPVSSGGPHVMGGCVVDASFTGHRYDFISLSSGQQTPITGEQSRAAGSMALASNRVALPDGTIRDPCDGDVIGRAARSGTFTTVECLTGSVVIGTGPAGQMAWKNGHKLWQHRTSGPLICDARGSVLMLSPAAHKIGLINPFNGRARWTVGDPGCPHHCISSSKSPVQVLASGGAVLLSDADQVLALRRSNGKLLWRNRSSCALAARDKPSAEVLLGSCPGQSGGATSAVTVAAATGKTIGTDSVSSDGCQPDGQWVASSRQLLVLCAGSSTGQPSYRAHLLSW